MKYEYQESACNPGVSSATAVVAAPSSAAAGAGRQPHEPGQEGAWRERGRALYGVPEPLPTPAVISLSEAQQTVARRLRVSLGGLSDIGRDSAVAAAALGYLEAHRTRSHAVSALDPWGASRRAFTDGSTWRGGSSVEPTRVLLDVQPSGRPPARRVHAPSSAATVTFQVTLGHALGKGLAGGRVRIVGGESPIDAVARRIARDTRCAIVAVSEEGVEVTSDGRRTLRSYSVTLRGSDGTREPAGRRLEGVLRVMF